MNKKELIKAQIYESIFDKTSEFIKKGQEGKLERPSDYVFNKNGFSIYLRYPDLYFKSEELEEIGVSEIKDFVVISNITAKTSYRGQGWFWSYVEFIKSKVSGGVVIERAGERLYNSLIKKPEFILLKSRSFYTRS